MEQARFVDIRYCNSKSFSQHSSNKPVYTLHLVHTQVAAVAGLDEEAWNGAEADLAGFTVKTTGVDNQTSTRLGNSIKRNSGQKGPVVFLCPTCHC